MIFVRRNARGEVTAVSRERIDGDAAGWDVANGDEPDVVAFAHRVSEPANPMSTTDLGLVRVLEDVIDLLIERAVIRFTDLPPAAQAKLMQRRDTRLTMSGRLSLLDDDNSGLL